MIQQRFLVQNRICHRHKFQNMTMLLMMMVFAVVTVYTHGYQTQSTITTIRNSQKTKVFGSAGGSSSSSSSEDTKDYSASIRLREEVESPFQKVRMFGFATLAGGAATSLAISMARIVAAVTSGINTDLLEESEINAAVDILGLVVIGALYQNDVKAQNARLERAAKGAALAKLTIKVSDELLLPTTEGSTLPLSAFRRGRGIDKRVVIAAGGPTKIRQVIQEATKLQDALDLNDLLIVPVVVDEKGSLVSSYSISSLINDDDNDTEKKELSSSSSCLPACVAMASPSNSFAWKEFIAAESVEASNQGVDMINDGYCIILKKNGRVGQRTKGVFLGRMVDDVVQRAESGLDIRNI